MWRNPVLRALLSGAVLSVVGVLLLVMSVAAQSDETGLTPTVDPAATTVGQVVPLTLTLSIPGPGGPVTVAVPVFVTLDIRVGIGSDLGLTLAVSPSVSLAQGTLLPSVTLTDAVALATPEATATAVEEEPTATPLPTATPTAAPLLVPTATPQPPAPVELPTPTPEPTAPPAAVVAPVCPDARAVITSPGVNQVVSGTVEVIGTAAHERFQYYKLEYAPGADADATATFAFLSEARVPVNGGVLTSFDSASLGNGVYTLRLTVVDNTGNFPPPCMVTVVIAN
jgi:hypothetical protein